MYYYAIIISPKFKLENPDIKSMGDVGKAAGIEWAKLDDEKKQKYVTQSKALFAAMPPKVHAEPKRPKNAYLFFMDDFRYLLYG